MQSQHPGVASTWTLKAKTLWRRQENCADLEDFDSRLRHPQPYFRGLPHSGQVLRVLMIPADKCFRQTKWLFSQTFPPWISSSLPSTTQTRFGIRCTSLGRMIALMVDEEKRTLPGVVWELSVLRHALGLRVCLLPCTEARACTPGRAPGRGLDPVG